MADAMENGYLYAEFFVHNMSCLASVSAMHFYFLYDYDCGNLLQLDYFFTQMMPVKISCSGRIQQVYYWAFITQMK